MKKNILILLMILVLTISACSVQNNVEDNANVDAHDDDHDDGHSHEDEASEDHHDEEVVDEDSEEAMEESNRVEIDVVAKQWEFVPNPIEVNVGDTVVLNINAIDVDHGIAIPEFGISEYLTSGQITTIEFVASTAGTFSFYCIKGCGAGHGNMKGSIVVS